MEKEKGREEREVRVLGKRLGIRVLGFANYFLGEKIWREKESKEED